MEFADRFWGAHSNSCFAADGRPGHRDDRKKSILLERAPSDVKKDGATDVKVTPEQRPNRTARDRRARILPGPREESKAKREANGAQCSEVPFFRLFESVQSFQHTVELAIDLLDTLFEYSGP